MIHSAKNLSVTRKGTDRQTTVARVEQFLQRGISTVRIIEMFKHAQCVIIRYELFITLSVMSAVSIIIMIAFIIALMSGEIK